MRRTTEIPLLPLLALLALLAAPVALAAAGPWQENDPSRVRLVTPWERAPVADGWTVGLEFETEPGWHVYWKNSGDAGYPPALDVSPTPAATGAELLWPAPERYDLPGGLVAFGYEEHVVYPVRLALDRGALEARARDGETLRLAADVDYLVCRVDCIPYAYRLEVEQALAPPGGEGVRDPGMAELLDRWRDRVPRTLEAAGLETAGVLDLADPEGPALLVRFTGVETTPAEPELFLEVSDTFDAGRPERREASPGELRFRVPLTFRVRPETLPAEADFAWTLVWPEGEGEAAGRGGTAVEARRTVPAREGGWDALAAGNGQRAPGPSPRPGPGALLLWAFLGGLLLHLTPGVLPLTAIRLGELPASGSVRRGALLSAAGALAGSAALLPVALALHAGGRAVTWGAQLQEPVPVALLALASTLVALNLWGFLGLPLRPGRSLPSSPADPAVATGTDDPQPSGIATGARAVLVGLAAVVLGLAWNLPPLARSLAPALAPEAGLLPGLLAVLGLGVGLALPFLAAAGMPDRLARLAPPGPASAERRSRLAEALAFVELGAVLWLLYLLSRQVAGEGLAFVQLALLGTALAAWWRQAAGRPATRAVAGVVLLVLALTSVWLAATYR